MSRLLAESKIGVLLGTRRSVAEPGSGGGVSGGGLLKGDLHPGEAFPFGDVPPFAADRRETVVPVVSGHSG
jgi:hypothetical protein